MMGRTWRRPGLAVLLAMLVAAPAFAHEPAPPGGGCRLIRGADTVDDPTDDVSVCREDVWFHKASTRVANLAGTGHDTVPSWNTTKPASPVAESAGIHVNAAVYDVLVAQDATGRAIFKGSFTGPLDTLAFQMYLRAPVQEAEGGGWPAVAVLKVDGEVLHDNFDTAAIDIPLKEDHEFRRMDGVFVNLYKTMADMGLDLSPTKVHDVQVEFVPWYFGDTPTAMFFDAAEVPSGLIFNLEPGSMSGFTKIEAGI